MSNLKKLVIECKKAITLLNIHLEHHKIDLPVEIGLDEMREWFLVMQGYAECLEKHRLFTEDSCQ